MKGKRRCLVPKVLLPSGKMMRLPSSWQCSSKATVKVWDLSRQQRSLDILDSVITKSLSSLQHEGLRDSDASRPVRSTTTVEPMKSSVKLYDIDFLIPKCLRR